MRILKHAAIVRDRAISLHLMVIIVSVALSSCATPPPPASHRVGTDPALMRSAGSLLLVDACIQKVAFSESGNYFVISESRGGSDVLLKAAQKRLVDKGIPIREAIAPFVCGAQIPSSGSVVRAADREGDSVREMNQPLDISKKFADDLPYVKALAALSTYAFERAAVEAGKLATSQSEFRIDAAHFTDAAREIRAKTGASTVIFLGLLGGSQTTGNAAISSVGRFLVSIGVAVATAGLGTSYYLVFIPGHQIDGRIMQSALIDLESGQLTWSGAVRVAGDPLKPGVVGDPKALDALFHTLIYRTLK